MATFETMNLSSTAACAQCGRRIRQPIRLTDSGGSVLLCAECAESIRRGIRASQQIPGARCWRCDKLIEPGDAVEYWSGYPGGRYSTEGRHHASCTALLR